MPRPSPLFTLLLATALACAQLAHAAPVKASKLDTGLRLFTQGDFEGALKNLDAASMEQTEPAVLEKIHLVRAQCFAARQDFAHAEEAFALALEANPDASLDPARVDPTLVRMLESVRRRLTGTLVVNSTPPGAALYLDTASAGVTPQTLTVPVGRHRLEARWGEGAMTSTEVSVRPRREIRVEWVEGAAPPPLVGPPTTPAGRPLRPFGDVRGTLEIPAGATPTGGLDVGGGFELSYFRLGLWARLFPYFGIAPRGALVVPVIAKVTVSIELSLPLWFRNAGVGLGLGGLAGAEYAPLPWLGFFGGIGGQHLFLNPNRNDNTTFIATAGARLRLP
ncbi:MAG: PEGA domain-containing protein [Archangium sp.]|nr:PEGA domain-containing protein [Archangium sp.]